MAFHKKKMILLKELLFSCLLNWIKHQESVGIVKWQRMGVYFSFSNDIRWNRIIYWQCIYFGINNKKLVSKEKRIVCQFNFIAVE